MKNTALMSWLKIDGRSEISTLNIHENDRILYSDCRFIGVVINISKDADRAFFRCFFEDCTFSTESNDEIHKVMGGFNIIHGGNCNGKKVIDVVTEE